jgi:hypothetical protein
MFGKRLDAPLLSLIVFIKMEVGSIEKDKAERGDQLRWGAWETSEISLYKYSKGR